MNPILFNIYINDLAFNLDDSNPSLLKLRNGTYISCLMYADDVILIASTPVGLQNLLDTVNGFCKDWRLTVNAIKSKCITFSRKNKKNKKEENVCQFTYLGVDISASGSLKVSMDSLCTKANRAKYALNNIAKFKHIPVKTAVRLFDATILPILTYGSEIWALNSTLDYGKWDSCPLEKSHLDFIRHILGTNRSVNNLMCRAELGRYPLCVEISCRVVNFYKYIKEIPKESIVYQTFLIDNSTQGLHAIKTLKQHITNLEYIRVPNISNLHKKSIRKESRSYYEIWWRDQIRTSTRGLFFLKLKQNICYEKYLDQLNQHNLRCSLSKIRLSDHKLMIEQGRKTKPKTPRQEQICVSCDDGTNSKIEDEVHFLFDCPWRKYILQRDRLICEIEKVVPFSRNMDSYNTCLFALSCEDSYTKTKIAIFINNMNKERESALAL